MSSDVRGFAPSDWRVRMTKSGPVSMQAAAKNNTVQVNVDTTPCHIRLAAASESRIQWGSITLQNPPVPFPLEAKGPISKTPPINIACRRGGPTETWLELLQQINPGTAGWDTARGELPVHRPQCSHARGVEDGCTAVECRTVRTHDTLDQMAHLLRPAEFCAACMRQATSFVNMASTLAM